MKYAFKNPAVEHAKNADMELYIISLAPFIPAVLVSKTFLIPRATDILDAQA